MLGWTVWYRYLTPSNHHWISRPRWHVPGLQPHRGLASGIHGIGGFMEDWSNPYGYSVTRWIKYDQMGPDDLWKIDGWCMEDWWIIDGWFMDDWWKIDGWLMEDWWMIYGWLMEDWMIDGRLMDDWWKIDGWFMDDWWNINGTNMDDLWMVT